MKEFFKKIHTERFRWYDEILICGIICLVLIIIGQLLGQLVTLIMQDVLYQSAMTETFEMYFATIGVWIVFICYMLVFRHRRPILKAIGTAPKGNTIRYLLIGLAIGFGMNFFCALVAMINRDIHISFERFDPLSFLLLLFAVFVQSSSEEVCDRAFYFQSLKKGYRSKWVAIIGNAAAFSLLHAFNPGVTFLALFDIFLSGLMFSLVVYYYDSLWFAFGLHTGWNFTQSILLGLPNSGIVVPYSIFKLDTASATTSFAYHVDFGIEGTILAVLVQACVCFLIWYFGSKRNQEPIDVYEGYEIKKKKEEAQV